MIEVSIDSIRVSLMSAHRIVVLKELGSERYLPIWIGPYEAEAIAMRLRNMEVQRPLTHDLLFNVIAEMGGEISRIVVTDLHDDTFYARINVQLGDEFLEIDSRPSDALALAVRAGVPVFVADEVMAEAGISPEADVGEQAGDEELSAFRDFINSLDLDDLPLQ